ncbi:MAG: hypothetical protein JKY50_00260 [Oleispira sp.]|nr:hypothetical protein [Oleispira sp.]
MSRKIIGFIEGKGSDDLTKGKEYPLTFGDNGQVYKDNEGNIRPYGGATAKLESDMVVFNDIPIYSYTPDIKVLQEARDLLAYKETLKPKDYSSYDVRCFTCKHSDTPIGTRPCRNCSRINWGEGESNWRPKDE